MLSHVSVGTTRAKFAEMVKFYDAIMTPLRCKRQMVVVQKWTTKGEDGTQVEGSMDNQADPLMEYNDDIVAVAYGKYFPQFWVQLPHAALVEATVGQGVHFAFTCSSEKQVQSVYETAMANGGTCNGPPGKRLEYSERYYGAFFIDPFGHKLEATFFDLGILMNNCQIL
jgi:predicted lactoylglutathione lyase